MHFYIGKSLIYEVIQIMNRKLKMTIVKNDFSCKCYIRSRYYGCQYNPTPDCYGYGTGDSGLVYYPDYLGNNGYPVYPDVGTGEPHNFVHLRRKNAKSRLHLVLYIVTFYYMVLSDFQLISDIRVVLRNNGNGHCTGVDPARTNAKVDK
ncbi:hypothetical protein OESDEN_03605 [Oesophagostomum dentatum]|uniref:Uncharacterized protein n=1 Tax=Oesophagostomum dentatum TaxID=61180 RepID=A0A0B1TKR9_OESDE|nr:hypothetical protein OESDEN_03605 [Oesophagostomum dentatum]